MNETMKPCVLCERPEPVCQYEYQPGVFCHHNEARHRNGALFHAFVPAPLPVYGDGVPLLAAPGADAHALLSENEKLTAEVERLRKGLEEIAAGGWRTTDMEDGWVCAARLSGIARRTLNEGNHQGTETTATITVSEGKE